MRNRGTGFTLIELVVTLSVIAILAALALPRYIALQTQARVAKTQAIFGGIRSASALAHAQVLATNTVTNGAATISMEGVNVTVMNGYRRPMPTALSPLRKWIRLPIKSPFPAAVQTLAIYSPSTSMAVRRDRARLLIKRLLQRIHHRGLVPIPPVVDAATQFFRECWICIFMERQQ